MRCFRNSMFAPPGGKWFYTIPELGLYVESSESFSRLLYMVKDLYRSNSLPIPKDLVGLVQDHMCARLPEGFCTGPAEPGHPRLYLTYFEVLRDTERILRNPQGLVPVHVAERRGAVCRACKHNSLRMCTSCLDLRRTAESLVSRVGALAGLSRFLGVCECTGCVVSGKVHLSDADIKSRVAGREELVDTCWMKPIA